MVSYLSSRPVGTTNRLPEHSNQLYHPNPAPVLTIATSQIYAIRAYTSSRYATLHQALALNLTSWDPPRGPMGRIYPLGQTPAPRNGPL